MKLLTEIVADYIAALPSGDLAKSTAVGYLPYVRRLARTLGEGATLVQFTQERLRAFVEESTAGRASGTRYGCISALRHFGAWLLQNRYLRRDPTRALKLPRVVSKPRTVLSAEELQALFGAANGLKNPGRRALACAVLALLYYQGLRRGELLALDVADIDLEGGFLHIRHGKGDKEAFQPLNEDCRQALVDLLAHRPQGCLHNGLLAKTRNTRLGERALYRRIDELCVRAGIDPVRAQSIRPHLFRHSFATALVHQGASLPDVQRAMRHIRAETTLRYVHDSQERQRQIVNLLSITPVKPAEEKAAARKPKRGSMEGAVSRFRRQDLRRSA